MITPNLTFSTTVAPIYQLGLIPHFVGVEENKFVADYRHIEKCINKKTVAIMIPNLLGNIANWNEIYNFAKENRALGLGVLGWHSLLQSRMLPFGSQEAFDLNSQIFNLIQKKSYKASEELAKKFGEPSLLEGYGRRNATLNAIAPTTSSAFILGQVSQGIEPIWSNIYVKDIAKTKTTIKNPFLKVYRRLEVTECS